jgi:hypothetical protein
MYEDFQKRDFSKTNLRCCLWWGSDTHKNGYYLNSKANGSDEWVKFPRQCETAGLCSNKLAEHLTEISDSRSGGYEDLYLLKYNAAEGQSTFRRNMSPSLLLNTKPGKKLPWCRQQACRPWLCLLTLPRSFFAWLSLQLWRWKRDAFWKRRFLPTDNTALHSRIYMFKINNDSISILWEQLIYYSAIMCDITHCLRWFICIWRVGNTTWLICCYSAGKFCCKVYLSL